MQKHCCGLTILLLCFLLAACGLAKSFQPPPPMYERWVKAGVGEQGVRIALLACGFPNAGYVDSSIISYNDYARGELCMLSNGFGYQYGDTLCDMSPELSPCKTAGVPQRKNSVKRPPAYEQWMRENIDTLGVQQAMRACGYTSVIEPIDEMLLNDFAAAQLCMVDHGFHFTLPANSLTCRKLPSLPACRGKVIDTVNCCAPPKVAGQR